MKAKLLIDCCGFKNGDIAKIIKRISSGYLVFVPGRNSTSGYAPNVWYHKAFIRIIK